MTIVPALVGWVGRITHKPWPRGHFGSSVLRFTSHPPYILTLACCTLFYWPVAGGTRRLSSKPVPSGFHKPVSGHSSGFHKPVQLAVAGVPFRGGAAQLLSHVAHIRFSALFEAVGHVICCAVSRHSSLKALISLFEVMCVHPLSF